MSATPDPSSPEINISTPADMHRLESILELIIYLGLITGASACSTIETGHAQSRAEADLPVVTNSCAGYGPGDITSHIFGIQGEIVHISRTTTQLKSLTIKITGSLPSAVGYEPYTKPGEVVTIRFDESISRLGSLSLAKGSVIRLDFGSVLANTKHSQNQNSSYWGSNYSWLLVERNGVFYNRKGEQFSLPLLESD